MDCLNTNGRILIRSMVLGCSISRLGKIIVTDEFVEEKTESLIEGINTQYGGIVWIRVNNRRTVM